LDAATRHQQDPLRKATDAEPAAAGDAALHALARLLGRLAAREHLAACRDDKETRNEEAE
jgi:hypothetical protein